MSEKSRDNEPATAQGERWFSSVKREFDDNPNNGQFVLVDYLTDLNHLATGRGLDWAAAVGEAATHYLVERGQLSTFSGDEYYVPRSRAWPVEIRIPGKGWKMSVALSHQEIQEAVRSVDEHGENGNSITRWVDGPYGAALAGCEGMENLPPGPRDDVPAVYRVFAQLIRDGKTKATGSFRNGCRQFVGAQANVQEKQPVSRTKRGRRR